MRKVLAVQDYDGTNPGASLTSVSLLVDHVLVSPSLFSFLQVKVLTKFLQHLQTNRKFSEVLEQLQLTVRFMKLRNFFSISVMMEKSPLGRFSLTVVTFIWWRETETERNNIKSL